MSDYFETQLREGTAQVAGSLHAHTAAAVREHAKRRARRAGTRAVAFATCAALVIGGTVLGLGQRGGRAAQASGVSGSNTPVPDSSLTQAARISATVTAPNPQQYVAGAWLDKSRLPYADAIAWQLNTQLLGTKLNNSVQLLLPDNAFFPTTAGEIDTYCSLPALTDSAVAEQQASFYGQVNGSSVPSYPGIPANVAQSIVFYPNQSAATAAWNAVASGFAACAKFETGHVSGESTNYPSTGTATRLINEPAVQCWTNLAAISNLRPEVTDQLDDVCFVQHGTLISYIDLRFDGPSTLAALDFAALDGTVSSELTQALTAYDSR